MSEEGPAPGSEMILYRTEDGRTRLEVRYEGETLWLSRALMAELFQAAPQNITLHLKALFQEGEILEETTCKDYLRVRQEEDQAKRRKQVFLKDWQTKLDAFPAFSDRRVLPDVRFEEHRRVLAEAEGESAIRQLEQTVKKLSKRKLRKKIAS